ncbi:MAG: serine/threonine-protein kinase [Myxococcota bacterium]
MTARTESFCPTCTASFGADQRRCPHDGTPLIVLTDADPLLGADIAGRFTIAARLGSGGMGSVYRAVQHSVARDVALKVMHERFSQDMDGVKRFVREARLASRVSHPNTVTVLDFGQTGAGQLYLAMELLRGRSLRDVLRDAGRFPVERAVHIAAQICDALDAAHRESIVHRDLKPSNVVFLEEPPVRDLLKVVDFGLAKSLQGDETTLTDPDAICGTAAYMPPEIVAGLAPTAQSDLYSLGVMLFEMLAGRLPFASPSAEALLLMHVREAPPALDVPCPPALKSLVARLLAKAPEERPSSAAIVREALLASIKGWHAPDSTPAASLPPPDTPDASATGDFALGTAPTAAAGALPSSSPAPKWPRLAAALGAMALLALAGWWLAVGGGRAPTTSPGEAARAGLSPTAGAPAAVSAPAPAPAPPLAQPDAEPPNSPDAASQIGAPAPAPAAPAPAATEPPAPPAAVTLRIESSPPAQATWGEKRLGQTPVDLELPRGDQPVAIRLTRAGYLPETRELTPSEDQTVRVTLTKRPREAPPGADEGFILPK